MNMPYVNVKFSTGAVINAYKCFWKYSQQFSKIINHLGDFHVMKNQFKSDGITCAMA